MKKLLKKKNNKGFSLVELIVVVLIMAIIAVALSPQVLKWVEKSRQATDAQNYDALIADLQIALTNKQAYAESLCDNSHKIVVTISDDANVSITGGSDTHDDDGVSTNDAATDAIKAALKNVQDDWETVRVKASEKEEYKIEIYNGNVWRTSDCPETDIENELATSTP